MTQERRENQVIDEYSRPVPGAELYVFTQDGASASLTSDGTTPLAQPVITDEFGNYSYYAVPSLYREDTYYGGKLRFKEVTPVGLDGVYPQAPRAGLFFAFDADGNPVASAGTGADAGLRTDLAAVSGASLVGGSAQSVADRTALAALSTGVFNTAHLRESGREGAFVFSSANLSTQVTADPNQGIYVAPSSDTTGASGAWVRHPGIDTWHAVEHWGAKGDNATDDSAAIQAAINTLIALGGTLVFAADKDYLLNTGLTISLASDGSVPIRLQGGGASFLRTVSNIDILTIQNTAGTTANTRRAILDGLGFIHSGATSRGLVLSKAAYCQFSNLEFLGVGQAIVVGTANDTIGLGNQFTNIRLTSVGTGVYIGSEYTIFTNLIISEGLQGGQYAIQIDGANCTVDGFAARGAGGAGGTATVLLTGNASASALVNGLVYDSYAIGISVGAASGVKIDNVDVNTSSTHGIQLSGTKQSIINVSVRHSSFAASGVSDQIHAINNPTDNTVTAQFVGTEAVWDINEATGTNNTWICGTLPNGRTSGATGSTLFANGTFQPNIQAISSAATVTPDFTNDQVNITGQAAALTLANWTGTATSGKRLTVRLKDNGTSQTIAYGTKYRGIGLTLPAATTLGKTHYLEFRYNSTDDKYDCILAVHE